MRIVHEGNSDQKNEHFDEPVNVWLEPWLVYHNMHATKKSVIFRPPHVIPEYIPPRIIDYRRSSIEAANLYLLVQAVGDLTAVTETFRKILGKPANLHFIQRQEDWLDFELHEAESTQNMGLFTFRMAFPDILPSGMQDKGPVISHALRAYAWPFFHLDFGKHGIYHATITDSEHLVVLRFKNTQTDASNYLVLSQNYRKDVSESEFQKIATRFKSDQLKKRGKQDTKR